MDRRTIVAAGYLMLSTSHSVEEMTAVEVVRAYRNRWPVELGFKRCKTIGGIDKLRCFSAEMARSWLLLHLLAVVMTDEFANRIAGFADCAIGTMTPSASKNQQEQLVIESALSEDPSRQTATVQPQIEMPEQNNTFAVSCDTDEVVPLEVNSVETPSIGSNRPHAEASCKNQPTKHRKNRISYWRAWKFARKMFEDAITMPVRSLTDDILEEVRKKLSESPRKRVVLGNALRTPQVRAYGALPLAGGALGSDRGDWPCDRSVAWIGTDFGSKSRVESRQHRTIRTEGRRHDIDTDRRRHCRRISYGTRFDG